MMSCYTARVTSRELRHDAGAAWLNLLATVGGRFGPAPVERLDSAERYTQWLAKERLLPAVPPKEADLAEARELRAALVHVTFALLDHEPVPGPAVELIGKYAERDRPPRLRVTANGLEALPLPDASAALARLARQAVDQLAGPARHQLAACADPQCRMVYLDPGGRRRWCAASLCGVKARVRAHRERAANVSTD
jgi:predicted RNA-binding Zn ribbon-like protein